MHIQYEIISQVAEVSLHRPPVNALSLGMIHELVDALHRVAADDEARAVILSSGLARGFYGGLDTSRIDGRSPDQIHDVLKILYIDLFDAQYKLGKPSIAAIGGAARGGGMTVAVS